MNKTTGVMWIVSRICLSVSAGSFLTIIGWGVLTGITGDSLVAKPFAFGWSLVGLAVMTALIGFATTELSDG